MPLQITATSTDGTDTATSTASLSVVVNPVMDMTMAAQDVSLDQAGVGTGIPVPLQLSSVDADEVATIRFHIPKGWSVTGASAAPQDYYAGSAHSGLAGARHQRIAGYSLILDRRAVDLADRRDRVNLCR